MSQSIRKMLVFGPGGTQGLNSDQDYLYPKAAGDGHLPNRTITVDTNSTWVRFWADWPVIQPLQQYAPDSPQNPNYALWVNLKNQVAAAQADGRNVMITSWAFPKWTNGTQNLEPNSHDEVEHLHKDRMTEDEYHEWKANGVPPPGRKTLTFKIPDDLSTSGPWAKWIDLLIKTFPNPGNGKVVAIEIMNEPNLQMFPLVGASTTNDPWAAGDIEIDCSIFGMMQTAQAMHNARGASNYLAAPALADLGSIDISTAKQRLAVPYGPVTDQLLDTFDAFNFKATFNFIWTHHNYKDVELDIGANSLTGLPNNRANIVRNKLVTRWGGWPQTGGNKNNPNIFITEGMADIDKVSSYLNSGRYGSNPPFGNARDGQAELMQRNWNRMHSDSGDGVGIASVAQYLTYSHEYDSGILDPSTNGTVKRPSYGTWKGFSGNIIF